MKIATLTTLSLGAMLFGCGGNGIDRCSSPIYVPQFTVTAFDSISGAEICRISADEGEFRGQGEQEECLVIVENITDSQSSNITISRSGYISATKENVNYSLDRCESIDTVDVEFFLQRLE